MMPNEQLLNYIRQQMASGVSREDITKELTTNGWQVSDISAAFAAMSIPTPSISSHPSAPIQQQSATSLNHVSNKRGAAISTKLIVLVAIAIIGGGAVFAYFTYSNSNNSNVSAPQTEPINNTGGSWTWAEHNAEGSYKAKSSSTLYFSTITSSADGTHLAAVDTLQNGGVYTSNDSGTTWVYRPVPGGSSLWYITSSADGTHLAAAGTDGKEVYVSADSGVTWVKRAITGTAGQITNASGIASSADGTHLAVAGLDVVYTSADFGVTWATHTLPQEGTSYQIALGHIVSSADGTHLAVIDTTCTEVSSCVFTSSDSGTTWIMHSMGDATGALSGLVSSADGTHLAASDGGTGSGGDIYTSSDSGSTWTAQTGAGQRYWGGIVSSADGTHLAAIYDAGAGTGGYIYTSSDSGSTWNAQTSAGLHSWSGIISSSDGMRLVALTSQGGVWIGTLSQ